MAESYRLLVPHSRAGVVVGKDGSRLHRLQSRTGADISVQPRIPGCDERVVHVSSEATPSPGQRTPSVVALERLAPLVQPDQPGSDGLSGNKSRSSKSENGESSEYQDGRDDASGSSRTFTVRILIPAKQGGPLLGTKGREIVKLREYANVTIDTNPSSGAVHPNLLRKNDYLVCISDQSLSNVKRALREAVYRLQRRPAGRHLEYRLLVPSIRAGRVIGRKGELLNETRQTTGAQIRFEPAPEDGSGDGDTERILSISAEEANHPGSLLPAQYALFSLAQRTLGTALPPNERYPVRLLVTDQAARSIIGTGGSSINQLREDYGLKLVVRQHGRHTMPACADEGDAVVEIPSHDLTKCMGALREVSEHLRGKRGSESDGVAGNPEDEKDFSSEAEPHEAGSAIVRTAVPSAQAGAVLGKQGKSIAHLRQVSGAKVVLGDRRAGTRILEISGTLQQVQAAQSLLQALLSSSQMATNEPPSAAVSRPLFPAAPEQANFDVSTTP